MAEISFEERMKVSHRAESTIKMLTELNKFQRKGFFYFLSKQFFRI